MKPSKQHIENITKGGLFLTMFIYIIMVKKAFLRGPYMTYMTEMKLISDSSKL